MFRDQRILAVIPARGGSKGIPLKNLRCVGGRSLVAWAADVVSQCDWIDRAVVSTDHDGIAAEAEAHGLARAVPPARISRGGTASATGTSSTTLSPPWKPGTPAATTLS